ncbi:MAG TPA: CerR family C-terminal domain-containing protein [Verrucomicrobiae bacterium]|jgi:AcrR family transcriptional regulator|nr:CerR family C-terminal domain-containing protein [Verrucomicrobiae bacterium]
MGFSLATTEDTGQMATRQHLLEAAGQVFAEVGFRAATVREICERAGANIAAVNYHFGDKEQLYRAVLQETYQAAIKKYPADYGLRANATAEERLRAFVHSLLLRIFSEGPSARHGKLMAREMMEPTGALDAIVREDIRPMSALLVSIVSELLGAEADDATKRLCANSVVSQALFYHHCRPVVVRIHPDLKFDRAGIERLTEHITRFSLAAITNLATKPRTGRAAKK